MKYDRFEDLPVWQAAADLAAEMFSWTSQPVFRGKGDLANQLQRAALSVSNNIAEGFERGTTNELLCFLYYARGSAGEVRSMLCVMDRMPEFLELAAKIQEFRRLAESISRQIRGWTNSLQNSEIKGQRHLNDRTRAAFEQQQRSAAFRERLEMLREEAERRRKRERAEAADTADAESAGPSDTDRL